NQFSLITQGDRSYFAAAGIGDLYRYFLHARREAKREVPGVALFNLLEEVVIQDTELYSKGISGSDDRRHEDPLPKARAKDRPVQPGRNVSRDLRVHRQCN